MMHRQIEHSLTEMLPSINDVTEHAVLALTTTKPLVPDAEMTTMKDLSGSSIANRFAEEAAKTLSYPEFVQPIQFLIDPRAAYGPVVQRPHREVLSERLGAAEKVLFGRDDGIQ